MFSAQNHMAFPGQGIYLKSLAQRKPHFSSISEAHTRIIDIHKTTPFKAHLIFDYYPMHKVRSVPESATAFRREHVVAAIVLMTWKGEDDKEGKYTDWARTIANDIAEIINAGQREMLITEPESFGYANYGRGL
jgi:hypothetical protein